MYELKERAWSNPDLYLDGKFIGFVGDGVGLQRCPECNRENHAMAVSSGCCAWCGWKIDIGAVEQLKEEA